MGQSPRCGRCDQDNLLEQDRWREPVSERQWYYDLDHVVREALKLDGHVPILAPDHVRSQHHDGLSYTTDFELIKDGSTGGAADEQELEGSITGHRNPAAEDAMA